jgi:hypothetical protein
MVEIEAAPPPMTEAYWRRRANMRYYKRFDRVMRSVARDARSMIDVGTGIVPYLEWFDWIPERVSVDVNPPYRSETVRGVQGDIFALDFPAKFDVCTCLQVLEHIPEPRPFARRLMDLSDLLVITVPYLWPVGKTRGHVNDPIDTAKFEGWFGRAPNWRHVTHEPWRRDSRRLIAIYDLADPKRRFDLRLPSPPWPL